MDEVQACRTCLATDVVLYNYINKNQLHLALKDVLQIKSSQDDGLPQYLCGICAALLMKYYKFRQRCMYTQSLLMDVAIKRMLNIDFIRHLDFEGKCLLKTLSTHNVSKITHIVYEEPEIKQELYPANDAISDTICKEEVFVFEDQLLNDEHKQILNDEPKNEITKEDSNDFPIHDNDNDDNDNHKIALNEKKYNQNKCLKLESGKSIIKDLMNNESGEDNDDKHVNEKQSKPPRKAVPHKKVDYSRNKSTKLSRKSDDNLKKPKRPNLNDEKCLTKMLLEKKVELKKLTTQEQIDEMQARKTSSNYTSSVFKCDQCFKGFLKESTYKNHMRNHDPSVGSFVCEICKMRYVSLLKLNNHVKLVHSKRYSCTLCNYVSVNWEQAKYHFNYHQGVLFKCKKCNKEFKIQSTYYTHMRISHPSEHVCDICGDAFLSSIGLRFHNQRSHKGEEPKNYCKDCGLYFKSDAAFDRHMTTASVHNEDGASNCHYCNHCGDSFRTDGELKTHLQQHKKSEKGEQVACEQCKKVLKNATQYASHYLKYHSEALTPEEQERRKAAKMAAALVCEVCGKKYSNKTNFEIHKRVHTGEKPFACPLCPKTFRTRTYFQIHERTHTGERPYKCPSCPMHFASGSALNQHSRVHSGLKPYQCSHCGKCFAQWSTHKFHVTTVHFKLPPPYKKRRRAKQTAE